MELSWTTRSAPKDHPALKTCTFGWVWDPCRPFTITIRGSAKDICQASVYASSLFLSKFSVKPFLGLRFLAILVGVGGQL